MKIFKLLVKNFSNKSSSIPPKLQSKNPSRETNKKKLNPIYNLLRTERFVESANEKINIEEKIDYETTLTESSKLMLMSYYKMYEDKDVKKREINNLYDFLQKFYNANELNVFITYLKKLKIIIDSSSVEKTEDVFKMFLDRVYNLNSNKNLNKSLMSLLTKISLKDVSIEEIFSKTIETQTHEASSQSEKNFKPLQKSIFFSQIESNFSTTLNIRNPVYNDIDKPQEDFKDAFTMKHEYMFKEPFLIQSNPENTEFNYSNYVYFDRMPFFYPVTEKGSDKMMIKILNPELIIHNNINLRRNVEYQKFVEKYLLRAVSKFNDNPSNNTDLNIQILSFTTQSTKQDHYDMQLLQESFDFIDEVFEQGEESKDPTMSHVSNYTGIKSNNKSDNLLSYDHLINNTRYFELRKQEIERELKHNLKLPILCSGFIKFNTYEDKKSFLNSGAGLFGTHLQGKCVNFLDADFCNVLTVKAFIGEDKTLSQIKDLINFNFKVFNEESLVLENPQYVNDIFDISNKNVDFKNDKIYIRYNSFKDLLKADELFKTKALNAIFKATVKKPVVRYYNEHFFSGMDLVFKNTITNLEKILSVPAGYRETSNIFEKEIY